MPLRQIQHHDERSLQDVADTIAKSHKQLLITGAGISTSCGIPDFRSKDGLYSLVPAQVALLTPPSTPSASWRKRKAYTTDDDDEFTPSQSSISSPGSSRSSPSSKLRGQDLFDARVFHNAESTAMFYQFIANLRRRIDSDVKKTSATHKFIRTLRDGGRLMRCYTQNIDGLEAREGLCSDLTRGKGNKRRFMKKQYESPRPNETAGTDFDGGCEIVQLHGELTGVRCRMCADVTIWTDEVTDIFLDGSAPRCEKCVLKSEIRVATGKRGLAVGELRPNIVLYGEDHPQNVLLAPLIAADVTSAPDTLIIMGTSLKVHGLQKVVRDLARAVHAQKNGRVIFVNRTKPSESTWDGVIDDYVAMDCDDWVADLKQKRADIWLRQGELGLKRTKSPTHRPKRKNTDASQDLDTSNFAKRVKIEVRIPPRQLSTPVSTPIKPRRDMTVYEDESTSGHITPRSSRKSFLHLASRSPTRPPFSPLSNGAQTPPCSRITAGYSQLPGRPPVSPITPTFSPVSSHSSAGWCKSMTPTPRTNAKSRLKESMSSPGDSVNNNTMSVSPRKRLAFVEVDEDTEENRPLHSRTAGEIARLLLAVGRA